LSVVSDKGIVRGQESQPPIVDWVDFLRKNTGLFWGRRGCFIQ